MYRLMIFPRRGLILVQENLKKYNCIRWLFFFFVIFHTYFPIRFFVLRTDRVENVLDSERTATSNNNITYVFRFIDFSLLCGYVRGFFFPPLSVNICVKNITVFDQTTGSRTQSSTNTIGDGFRLNIVGIVFYFLRYSLESSYFKRRG